MRYIISSLLFFFFAILLIGNTALAQIPPHPIQNDKDLHQILLKIYASNPYTTFCNESFNKEGLLQTFPIHSTTAEKKIQWMPLVTKKELAATRPCFENKICMNKNGQRFKGLLCCKQSDALYKIMLYDLHNRLPTSKHILRLRSTLSFDAITQSSGEKRQDCALYFHAKTKVLEPEDALKGEIARIYLYMHDTYSIPLSQSKIELFKSWHYQYPPSPWEKKKNLAIQKIQGNVNPYVLNSAF